MNKKASVQADMEDNRKQKPVLQPPSFAECEQSNYGKIVVVMMGKKLK